MSTTERQNPSGGASAQGAPEAAEGLGDAIQAAERRSAPTLVSLRSTRDELRRRLAEAEDALREGEALARRELQAAFRGWYEARSARHAEEVERAAAFEIGTELREIVANREVVLATTHPTLHGEIAGAFDRRIEELTARAEALSAPLPEEGGQAPPVLVGVAWLREEPPVLEAVVLRMGAADRQEALAAAFRDLAVGLGGNGQVQALDEAGEPLRLVAGVGARTDMAAAELSEVLSGRASERLARCPGWPSGARAVVQPVDAAQVSALDAALWPAEGPS